MIGIIIIMDIGADIVSDGYIMANLIVAIILSNFHLGLIWIWSNLWLKN